MDFMEFLTYNNKKGWNSWNSCISKYLRFQGMPEIRVPKLVNLGILRNSLVNPVI